MNDETRDLWFRALQVFVAAPWVYIGSNRPGTPLYFQIGLKALAGALVMINGPTLVRELAKLAKGPPVQMLTAEEAARLSATRKATEDIQDAEYVTSHTES